MTENYIAIGDIHGRVDLLDALLNNIRLRPAYRDYRLAFLGDMVDRGPDSYLVLERIKCLVEQRGDIAILGNHEDMMIQATNPNASYDATGNWFSNGGGRTILSYMRTFGDIDGTIKMSAHLDWLKTLPLFYETEKVWFSHAPIPPEEQRKACPDFRTHRHSLLWTFLQDMGLDESDAHYHGKLAVCGHVHAIRRGILKPRIYPKIIYADTGSGCASHAPLSGVVISDGKMVDNIQAWPEEAPLGQ